MSENIAATLFKLKMVSPKLLQRYAHCCKRENLNIKVYEGILDKLGQRQTFDVSRS
jgi:hypothetical protein